jgi:hypothetical protein
MEYVPGAVGAGKLKVDDVPVEPELVTLQGVETPPRLNVVDPGWQMVPSTIHSTVETVRVWAQKETSAPGNEVTPEGCPTKMGAVAQDT